MSPLGFIEDFVGFAGKGGGAAIGCVPPVAESWSGLAREEWGKPCGVIDAVDDRG